MNLAYKLNKKDAIGVVLMTALLVALFYFRGVDYDPGVSESCEKCSTDVGSMERAGHFEEMLWNGALHVHHSSNDNLVQFTRSNGLVAADKSSVKNCIDCHSEGADAVAPSLGQLWVKFPRLDKETGRIIDFEKAVQYEFVKRYGGTKPFYNDVRITEIMVYAFEKARQKGLVFDVEPDDGVPLTNEQLDALETSPVCRNVFDEYGVPKGDIAPYIVKGCNIFTQTNKYRPAGYSLFWDTRMNCTSCHLNGGTKEYAAHMADAAVNYPMVYSSQNIVYTNRMRIARCYAHSINEVLYGSNSEFYKLIGLYIAWIGEKNQLPVGTVRASRGVHNIRGTAAQHASNMAGQKAYVEKCQQCHGPAGYGTDKYDNDPFLHPPPITGSDSFVRTATMSYPERFASFIQNNMPPGSTHEHPQITEQEALDIAEFIQAQTRPSSPSTNNLSVFYNYMINRVMEWWFAEKTGANI